MFRMTGAHWTSLSPSWLTTKERLY